MHYKTYEMTNVRETVIGVVATLVKRITDVGIPIQFEVASKVT